MKVYIGKYPNNWWTTRNWAERVIARRNGKEFGFEVDEEDYDWVDRLVSDIASHWQSVLNVTINPILRKFYKRKIKIRIDRCDTWSMDHTLGLIILPMLKQLKATKHGSGYIDLEDVPEYMRCTTTEDYDSQKCFQFYTEANIEGGYDIHRRYDWVLDEMIWAFEQLQPDYDWEAQYRSGEHDIIWMPDNTKLDENGKPQFHEMKHGPNDTYKCDYDALQKHQDRISNGLRLFGKYDQTLWD